MIVDENPRKKLYKTLISSSDPEVKQHFSQWTEDEFDKSLSTDKEFQQSLFDDLKGIGLAKDQAAFSKEYVPAMVPAGKTTTAATPAPPAKQKPVQAAPVEQKPKTLKESIGQSVTGVIDWTKGLIQKNDLFGRWTSFGGDQKKREDQANKALQTEFIPGAVTTAKKDLELYERVKGTQIDAEEKIRQARSDMNMPLVRPDMAAEEHVQRKARLQKVIDDNQVILNATSKDRRQIEARTQRHVNDMISSIVEQELPENAYVKSKTGKRIPNEIWVQDRTRELVKKYGLPDGKYAYSLLKSGLSASLLGKERLPELKARAAKIFAQKHGGKSMEQVIGDQEASGVQQLQAINNGYKNEAATFGAQLNAEYGVKEKELLGSYRSAQASLDKKIAEDAEIKQFVDRLDQDMRAPLQALVNDNKISAVEANKMLTSKESADKRKTLILEQIDKKYGVDLAANYNTYLDGVSEINTKKKNRYERQMAEKNRMYQQAFESKKKELLAANKKFSPQLIKEIGQAYDEASKQIDKEEKTMLANSDMEANIFAQTYNGLMKGIGQGLEATAFAIGARNLSDFGAIIASEHETSDLSLSGWDSYTFSKEGLTRAVNSVSITGGRMLPGMAATAAIAAATRGTAMPLLSRILLASVPQFGFETADIVGSTELEMLAKTGDVAKAKLAGERALKSQMGLALTYGFSALPYFGEITRKLVPLGRFGKASAGARVFTAATIETGEEAFLQELPQNIFNTLIMDEKDPDLVGLWKNYTTENVSKTLSEVLPITALFGGVPQAYKEGKASVNQMITAGYYAKNILKDASHPSRLAENQVQFITQLYDKKGMGFAGGMISTLLHNGSIDRARAEVLAQKLDSYERFNSADAIKNIKNSVVKQAAFVLFDRYQEAKNTNNKEAADKALGDYNNFLMGKGAELIMLRMPDGDSQVYTYDDFNSLMNSPEFQEAASKQEKQYGGVFEITPFAQNKEALENPKLKQILEKFGAIQNSDVKEKDEVEETDKAQNVVSDEEIEAAQKRTGFKMPQFNELVPAEVAAILDAVRSGEKDLTSDEISGASAYLYDLYKIYNNMQKSSTRNLTIDQITGLSQQFADALNDISNYKRSIAFAPGEAPEETAPPAPTQQQQVPIEQQVQDDIANKRFANATFDSEDQVPDELKPYLPRAVRFTQDGKQKIQITAPATLIQGPSATTQAAPVEEVSTTTEAAPVEEPAPVSQTEQVPPAEPKPQPQTAPAMEVGVGGIIRGHEDIVGNEGLGDVRNQLPEENSGVIIANGKDGNQYAVAFSRKGGDRQIIFEQGGSTPRPGHVYTSVKINDPSNVQEVEAAKKQAEAALQNILPTVKNGNINASDIKDAMASFQSTKPSEAPAAQTTKPSEAPAAEAPQATAQEGQLKGKVKLFTDDDAINSFNQEQTETYERLIFMGQDAIAKQMVDAQKQAMVAKEIEQVERGEISDKVRDFYKKFGIGIETLSTEDFVRVLRENGAAAERSQEAVFDDVNGKIYINKDVFQTGLGTLVIWHDSVHPIMNIIHNSNKPLYDKIHRAIEAGIKANPEGGMAEAKKWVDRTYTDAAGYNDASRKDELIVEVIGMLASGRLSFNEIQPNLRQRLMDLINRIGRILGVSKAEVSDMGAIKDLAKKITAEINKAGKGDLSKIVGAENVGKFQRPGALSEKMAARLSKETQAKVKAGEAVGTRKPTAKKSPDLAYNKDLLIGLEATKANPALYKFNAMLVASYDIMYPVLPPTIKTYLNGIYKTLNKYQNEADTLRDEIDAAKKEIVDITAKQEKLKKTEAAKLTTRIIAGEVKRGGYGRLITDLRKKIDRLEQLTQKDGLLSKERERVRKEIENYAKEKMTMQMADRIYKEFIGITQSNLEALVNLFPARLREVAKLWYDGANLIAQDFAKKYKTSIEQAAAVLAVFSPQKDWFMNISLAERLMNIYNNMMDYKFDDAMASKYLKRAGEPELTIDEKTGEEKWTGGAVPLLDEDGEHVEIDGMLQFKNWDNEKAKARIDDAAKTLKSLRGKSLRELLDEGQLDKAARFVRMYSEVYDSPNFSFYTPDGRKGYESRSEKGTLRKIAWGGYNTIEKALKIMEATEKNKMDVIHNELGEMHKVRSFYNNIADPLSKDGHVTMDTHAIAAILWKALSGASFEVTQNFGGAGTKSEASIGSNGLYPVFAEAYREAANNLGYLPREIQSITWEAVRMLFKAKWKGNKENVKKIGNIWAKFRNGELTIEQAREQIWSLATAGTRGTTEEAIRNGEGVGSPDWAEILDSGLDPERVRKANDAVRLSMAGGVRYDGKRGVGRPGDVAGAAGVVPGLAEGGKPGGLELKPQPSLGGREKQGTFEPEKKDEESKLRSERAGDRGGRPESRETAPLEGAPSVPGVNGPDPQLVAVAERYAKANGIPLKRQSEYVKVDVNRAKRIAEAYAEMKHDPQNPKVKEAYKDLIKQTVAQYEALAQAGYKFWFIDTNIPSNKEYAETPFNALRDIRKNKEMGVFPTTDGFGSSDLDVSDNPLMEETKYKWPVGGMDGELKPVLANDLFRAVHDAFGHGLEGAAFRARGEENAWQAHIRLFTGAAQGAITSETRGQNSWLNFNSNILKDVVGAEKAKELHPDNWETITVGEHNRNAKTDDTIFADQKTGLMPEWTWTEGRAGDMQEGGTQASLGGRQAAPSFADLDKILDMPPAKSRAAREKLIDQYGKETVDRMIEISRNFTKIINGLEEQGVVEKDCP